MPSLSLRQASSPRTSSSSAPRPLYVFGYGSLMWRPDFPYIRKTPAMGLGCVRSLCVWSSAYRGSPERPGLVFGLDQTGNADACRGMLFEVAPKDRRQVIAYLFQRELIYPIYRPAEILAECAEGVFPALTFTVDTADPAYAAGLAPNIRIAAIASGRGRAGRARDYLAAALERLLTMDADEPALRAELAAADLLPDDPAVLFTLLDQAYRRRLNSVFELAHE